MPASKDKSVTHETATSEPSKDRLDVTVAITFRDVRPSNDPTGRCWCGAEPHSLMQVFYAPARVVIDGDGRRPAIVDAGFGTDEECLWNSTIDVNVDDRHLLQCQAEHFYTTTVSVNS